MAQFLENACKKTASGPPLLETVVVKKGRVKYKATNGAMIEFKQHGRVNKGGGIYHRNDVVPQLQRAGLLEAFMDSKY